MSALIAHDDPIWAEIGLGDDIDFDWDCDLLQSPITPRSPPAPVPQRTEIPTTDSALTDDDIDNLAAFCPYLLTFPYKLLHNPTIFLFFPRA